MTSIKTLVTTMSMANAAVVFTDWEGNSGQNGLSIKLSDAMNQYRACVSIADDYQLNLSLCSQQNGLEIITDMANTIDSYDYSVSINDNFSFFSFNPSNSEESTGEKLGKYFLS